MVYRLEDRVKARLDVTEVDRPSHYRIQWRGQVQPKRVGVPITRPLESQRARLRCCAVQREVLPDAVVRPSKLAPQEPVSKTVTQDSSGSPGLSRSQSQDEMISLVGLSGRQFVQAPVVELDVQRCPKLVEVVVVDAKVP